MIFYPLFSGITLAYIEVNTPIWPESNENTSIRPLRINYCISGRSELLLDDNAYIYLKEHDFCISEQAAQKEYIFPTSQYQGIEIFLDMNLIYQSDVSFLNVFNLDLVCLKELYCTKSKTYIADASVHISNIFNMFWELLDTHELFYMRHYVLELIYILCKKDISPFKACAFYTQVQVEIARKAECILTTDLRQHIPIRLLARQFCVSETKSKELF